QEVGLVAAVHREAVRGVMPEVVSPRLVAGHHQRSDLQAFGPRDGLGGAKIRAERLGAATSLNGGVMGKGMTAEFLTGRSRDQPDKGRGEMDRVLALAVSHSDPIGV